MDLTVSSIKRALLLLCPKVKRDEVRFSDLTKRDGCNVLCANNLDCVDVKMLFFLLSGFGATGYIRMCDGGSRLDIYIPIATRLSRIVFYSWACFGGGFVMLMILKWRSLMQILLHA